MNDSLLVPLRLADVLGQVNLVVDGAFRVVRGVHFEVAEREVFVFGLRLLMSCGGKTVYSVFCALTFELSGRRR